MRIAVISNTYPPQAKGGAGRIAATYTELLAERGHVVKVWTAGEEFLRLSSRSPLSRLRFHLQDLSPRKDLVEEIVAWKPDVLLTHNLTGCGFATPGEIKKKGIRWTHVLHDVQLIEPSGQIVHGESFVILRAWWRFLWSSLRRSVFGSPDGVVSPTRWLLDLHRRYGWFHGAPTNVIPNPLKLDSAKSSARDLKRLLFVGRTDADKGIHVLLSAWKKVRSSFSELVIVGDGAAYESHGEIDGVTWHGLLSPEDVAAEMAKSGTVVVPSLVMENQPTVVLEALAAGCGVVASDVGGVKETLGQAGTVIPPGDVEALVRALQELDVKDGRSASARDSVLRLHDPVSVVADLEDFLTSNR